MSGSTNSLTLPIFFFTFLLLILFISVNGAIQCEIIFLGPILFQYLVQNNCFSFSHFFCCFFIKFFYIYFFGCYLQLIWFISTLFNFCVCTGCWHLMKFCFKLISDFTFNWTSTFGFWKLKFEMKEKKNISCLVIVMEWQPRFITDLC